MGFVDEIKMWWQLRKVVAMMQKLLGKFDGLKTIIGLLGVVAYYMLPRFGVTVPDVVLKIALGFVGVGVTHKFEKAFGLASKVIDYGHKALDGLQAVLDALSKQDVPA